jgi:hypothetical protein
MKPEKHFLIRDLLDDNLADMHRSATLHAGGRILRHKRWRRAALRSLPAAALIMVAALVFRLQSPAPHRVVSSVSPQAAVVHHLTDDQLLALFPNTPVGLATVAGRKVLIFPRQADRERFIGSF